MHRSLSSSINPSRTVHSGRSPAARTARRPRMHGGAGGHRTDLATPWQAQAQAQRLVADTAGAGTAAKPKRSASLLSPFLPLSGSPPAHEISPDARSPVVLRSPSGFISVGCWTGVADPVGVERSGARRTAAARALATKHAAARRAVGSLAAGEGAGALGPSGPCCRLGLTGFLCVESDGHARDGACADPSKLSRRMAMDARVLVSEVRQPGAGSWDTIMLDMMHEPCMTLA